MNLQNENLFDNEKNKTIYKIIVAICLLAMTIIAPLALNWIQLIKNSDTIPEYGQSIRIIAGLFIIVALLDILIAWALNQIFKKTQQPLSELTMFLRIVYAILLIGSLNSFFNIQQPLNKNELINAFFLFDTNWSNALALFGFHLIFLGILIIRSKFISFILGILIIIAGIGYLFDSLIKLLIPNTKISIALFTFIGEPLLIIWLPVNAIRTMKKIKKLKTFG